MSAFAFLALVWRSLWNRRTTAILTILSIALSVTLFLGVDKIRRGAENAFNATISGTDVIVGAPSGSINLLLYSVFHIGEPTASISWQSYERYAENPDVAWVIPISLGDSHQGFRVLGTNQAYFEHFQYGAKKALAFNQGRPFTKENELVLGAEVAKSLGYALNDEVIIAHGIVSVGFSEHKGYPFTVVGILAPTGTPVDRTVHVTLAGIEAMHDGFQGTAMTGNRTPDKISAFLIGLKNRSTVQIFIARVNADKAEPLQAIMPGIALAQLWDVVGAAQTAFTAIAGFVVLTGLLGLLTAILTSLNERRREIAVLRAAGARRGHIFSLLVTESTLIAALGAIVGAGIVYSGLYALGPLIQSRFGIPLSGLGFGSLDVLILAGIVLLATLLGMVPAWRAYRNSLADGLSVKI